MLRKSILFASIFIFSIALPASANVVINEVAWMGSSVSGTKEWIELLNDGNDAVDLSGWTLNADDGSPSITLFGTIGGGGYYLIERNDDTAVPSVTADITSSFGSGLSNSGETLRLKDKSGQVLDTLVSGANWSTVGGDNTTKQTAQRTANGWVTGNATPRSPNVLPIVSQGTPGGDTTPTTQGASTGSTTSTSTQSSPTSNPTPLSRPPYPPGLYPKNTIVVEAGDDQEVFTHFPIHFVGSSTGLYNEPLSRALYHWNFGDGTTCEGANVTHSYDFEGEYIVTLEVFWGNMQARDRARIVVTSPGVTIGNIVSGKEGYVILRNDTDREIDLSEWSLQEREQTFILPHNSFILPQHTFLLANHISGLSGSSKISLVSPHGHTVTLNEIISKKVETSQHAGVLPVAEHVQTALSEDEPPTDEVLADSHWLTQQAERASTTETSRSDVATSGVLWKSSAGTSTLHASGFKENAPWVMLLVLLMLIIIAGMVIARANQNESSGADDYAIIEESIEGSDE